MILTDKPYIQMPSNDTPLMHYLDIFQLLSILKYKNIFFSSVSLYKDALEATLTQPSYKEVSECLLWDDNTPVQKDKNYVEYKKSVPDKSSDDLYWNENIWEKDTFAHLITSFSRHFMFTHCWTISKSENILMWDRYKHQGSTIAIRTTIDGIKSAFDETRPHLYIGRIQYKDYQTEHITGFQRYAEKDLADPEIIEKLFYQPVFHKEILYQSENEVRLIISYKDATEEMLQKTYLTDIPFYTHNWGFELDRNNFDRPNSLRFRTEEGNSIEIFRQIRVEVDIQKLIDYIILSPYTVPYALSLIQDLVSQYGVDPKKVVKSSIKFR